MPIRHAFISPKIDTGDATLLQPSHWAADHIVTGSGMAPAQLVGTSVNSTSLVLTFGSSPSSTSMLFMGTSQLAATGTISSVVQTNVTWTKLHTNSQGTSITVELWRGVPTGAPGTTITLSWTGTLNTYAAAGEWLTGHGLAGTVDKFANAGGAAATSQMTGFIKPSSAGALTFAIYGCVNGTIPLRAPLGPFNAMSASVFALSAYCWGGAHGLMSGVALQTSSIWANAIVSII